jgi:hypothetical protein
LLAVTFEGEVEAGFIVSFIQHDSDT